MTVMESSEIMKVLAHRYPILLVDRIIENDGEKRIVGLKNVTVNEPFFQGHFPGMPIMPGVLQLEAMAQTGGILLCQIAKSERAVPYFMAIDKAKFRKVVQPGDQLRIEIEIIKMRRNLARFTGKITVDGAVASQAELTCMITDEKTGA